MEPGDEIKRLRERAGLALSDLAAQTGLFLNHLHDIESGRDVPSAYAIQAIADCFRRQGLTESDLSNLRMAASSPAADDGKRDTHVRDLSDRPLGLRLMGAGVAALLGIPIVTWIAGLNEKFMSPFQRSLVEGVGVPVFRVVFFAAPVLIATGFVMWVSGRLKRRRR